MTTSGCHRRSSKLQSAYSRRLFLLSSEARFEDSVVGGGGWSSTPETILHCFRCCRKTRNIWKKLNFDLQCLDLNIFSNKVLHAAHSISFTWTPPQDLIKDTQGIMRTRARSHVLMSVKLPRSRTRMRTLETVRVAMSHVTSHVACLLWLRGYMGALPYASVRQSELFAIWQRLLLSWEAGHREVTCETDYLKAFNLIGDQNMGAHCLDKDLVSKIQEILKWRWKATMLLQTYEGVKFVYENRLDIIIPFALSFEELKGVICENIDS
ncbi:hypothetical protein Ahy_A07g032436 [Arachis hypogaea]|uniref:RNase H type-1 domain-containing protein n=1 Tax=Arachis hypogaea TaxID=3818 RepID=A0A445C6Z9_ARAHY|nr:hypothetical protein Ahy_A07g032436 [Arachis hypogaea]